ncbi:MAG: hypothetical protein LBU34_11145 [Planctomycetaceae bacterium]|jgi:hypothetical protein|nr:hypothetical protein [Planctomycetaceae bacterium]
MSEERFELTAEEIRCLQELTDGWKTIWDKISVELLIGKNGNGRLHNATWRFRSDNPRVDLDDFISFIYEQYYKDVLTQTRFINYDYDKYGGDVFAYLCDPFIIRQMFLHYKKKNTLITTPSTKGLNLYNIRYDNQVTGKDSTEKSFIESIDDKSHSEPYSDESNPLQVLSKEKWVLTISPTAKGTFYSKDIHAGLQLYLRIDYADKNMLKLQEDIHKSVTNADKSNNKPQAKIEREHKAAAKRIDETINTISDKLFDIKRQKVRNVNVTVEKDMKRKIAKCRLQEIYRPLDAMQIVDLLGVNRTNADQTIKRYYELVTDILPLSEDAKEQFRLLFLQTFQNEKGKNDG